MKSYLGKLAKKTGLPPGTAIHIGPDYHEKIKIMQVIYDSESSQQTEIDNPKSIHKITTSEEVNWVDVRGISDVDLVSQIGAEFDLHGLMIEDIVNAIQLPKIDEHEQSLFLIIKAIAFENDEVSLEHICLFFRRSWSCLFKKKQQIHLGSLEIES